MTATTERQDALLERLAVGRVMGDAEAFVEAHDALLLEAGADIGVAAVLAALGPEVERARFACLLRRCTTRLVGSC